MTDEKMREALVTQIVRDVAELPDRTSPEDQPDMMLVTADELTDILRAAASLEQVTQGPAASRRVAWLIERQPAGHTPAYLAVGGTRASHNAPKVGGEMYWSNCADDALQFTQRPDAIAFVSVMLGISNALPLGLTTPGLRSCDPMPTVHEHMWVPGL